MRCDATCRSLFLWALFASAGIAQVPPAPSSAATADVISQLPLFATRQNVFAIPFSVDRRIAQPVEVHLYVSSDQGVTWQLAGQQPPAARQFSFRAQRRRVLVRIAHPGRQPAREFSGTAAAGTAGGRRHRSASNRIRRSADGQRRGADELAGGGPEPAGHVLESRIPGRSRKALEAGGPSAADRRRPANQLSGTNELVTRDACAGD